MSAPFMQLYVADYLGDTRHLTTEQHGAYLLLLMTMWRADGRLPHDDRKLARLTGCTASRWAKIRDDVLAFFVIDGDEITHGRLMFELEKASEKSIKRAEAGSLGGSAKPRKTKESVKANATVLPKHSSEPDIRIEANASIDQDERKAGPDFAVFWKAYPAKVAKKAAVKAWNKATDKPALADLLDALSLYRQTKPPDRDWCHASTWLTNGRWADEPPSPRLVNTNDRSSTKLDHLDGIRRAMEAACQPDFNDVRDRWEPGDGGRMRALPSAA